MWQVQHSAPWRNLPRSGRGFVKVVDKSRGGSDASAGSLHGVPFALPEDRYTGGICFHFALRNCSSGQVKRRCSPDPHGERPRGRKWFYFHEDTALSASLRYVLAVCFLFARSKISVCSYGIPLKARWWSRHSSKLFISFDRRVFRSSLDWLNKLQFGNFHFSEENKPLQNFSPPYFA